MVDVKTRKLRFPSFSNEWEVKKLGDLSKKKFSNGVFNDPAKVGNGYRLINVKDMYVDGYIDVTTLTKVGISKGEFLRNKIISGDIFFTRSSLVKEGIAYTNIYLGDDNDITFDGHLIKMSPDKNIVYPLFIYYLSKTNPIRRQLVAYGNTTTMTTIGQSELSSVDVPLPSLEEQEKIAGFLKVVDDKISTLQNKKKLLHKYKKGVTQKVFSQEIRFKPDVSNPTLVEAVGRVYPAWQVKKLDDVLTKSCLKNKSASIILVQSVSNKKGLIDQTDQFKDHVVASKNLSNYYVVEQGTFVYNPSRIDVGSLAYKFDNETSVVSPLYVCFKAKKDFLIDAFLLYWLESSQFLRQMQNSFEGSVRNTLSYDSLKKMTIHLPSVYEQHKIADLLTGINEKLEAEERKLEQAKKFNKALLQQMLV